MRTFEAQNRSKADLRSALKNFFDAEFDKTARWIGEQNGMEGRLVQDVAPPNDQVVMSTYFTSKRDPQRNTYAPEADYSYFKEWYESILRLQMHALIFTDCEDEHFLSEYSKDCVCFVQCKLGPLSLNDERFFLYAEYLVKHAKSLSAVFMTDINDVTFLKNPFQLVSDDLRIFVGRNNTNRMIHSNINMERIQHLSSVHNLLFGGDFYMHPIYNAGILGGKIQEMTYFVSKMCKLMTDYRTSENINMLSFNMTIYQHFAPRSAVNLMYRLIYRHLTPKVLIFIERLKRVILKKSWDEVRFVSDHDPLGNTPTVCTSYPLHNRYKSYQANQGVYIMHK